MLLKYSSNEGKNNKAKKQCQQKKKHKTKYPRSQRPHWIISSEAPLLCAKVSHTNILHLSLQKQTKPWLCEEWGCTKSKRDKYNSDKCLTSRDWKANLLYHAKCSLPICSLEWSYTQNWFHAQTFLSKPMFLRELQLCGIITWCSLSCKQFTVVYNPPSSSVLVRIKAS